MIETGSSLVERKTLSNDVCRGIIRGKYYSVLGPRRIGKTTFLKQVKARIEKEHANFKCVYIDLRAMKTATPELFYPGFAQKISEILALSSYPQVESVEKLDAFILSSLDSIQGNIILLLDDIEHIPEYITNDLLVRFRMYHQARERERIYKRLSVIISGSTNLLEFTMGKVNSPFNIAHPVLLSDLDHAAGSELIDNIMILNRKQMDPPAKEKILAQTNGHPYLLSRICSLCLRNANQGIVDVKVVDKSIRYLIEHHLEEEFFTFIMRNVETDIDIFETLIEILEKGSSTPKQFEITIGKHELSGVFLKEKGQFLVRNQVIHRLFSNYLDAVRKADILLIHGQWEKALDLYKNLEPMARMKRRRSGKISLTWRRTTDIIKAIGHFMHLPAQEEAAILKYLLEGIYYVLSYDSVYLYLANREKNCLVLEDFRGEKAPADTIKIEDSFSQVLEVRAVDAGRYIVEDKNEQNNYAAAFPLQLSGGVTRWVLSVNNHTSRYPVKKLECEELKIFTHEALLAIMNSRSYFHLYLENQATLDAVGDELSIVDGNYTILYMNREKIERIGKDYSGTSEKCYKIFAHLQAPCPNCPCMEAMQKKKITRRSEYYIEYHNDGKQHYVLQTASPLKDLDGNCTRSVKVVSDFTRQKMLFDIIAKLQKELDLNRIISIIVDGIVDIGYKRVRFYDYIKKEDGSEFAVGRISRGMETVKINFRGYRIDLKDAVYIEERVKEGKPCFYYGDKHAENLKGKKWLEDLELVNVKWMDLPLISRQGITGFIGIDNKSSGEEFTGEELEIMAILAYYAAQAIENSRYIESQKILYGISKELSRTLDIEKLQENIVETVCQILKTEICSIFIYDEKRDMLIMKTTYLYTVNGWTHSLDFEEKYEIGTYICGKVYEQGKPLIIDDIPTYHPRHRPYINKYENLLRSGKVINSIFAPLTFKDKKIGIIRASNKLDEDNELSATGFRQDDLDLLVSLGEQIAIALANSELYENQKNSIRQLKLLTDISNFIKKEMDLDKILYLLLTGLTIQGGMDFNRAVLFLGDNREKTLKAEMALSPGNDPDTLKFWTGITTEKKDNRWMLNSLAQVFDLHKKELMENRLNKKCKTFIFEPDDENVLVNAFKEKKTLFSSNKDSQHPDDSFLKEMKPFTWAITPLIIDEEPIGVIYVDNRYYYHTITGQQIEILRLFANQAATAIHNWQIDKEKNLQRKGLEALNIVISMITSASDLKDIYGAVEKTREIFPDIDEMCLSIKKGEEYSIFFNCPIRGIPECQHCKKQEITCIDKGGVYRPYYSPDIEKDLNFKKALKQNLKSRFIVPLVFEKELLGIFDIGSKKVDAFSEFDRRLFTSLGWQIAIAINNRIKQDQQLEIYKNISHTLGAYLTTMRGYTQRLISGKVKDEVKREEYLKRLFTDVLALNDSVDVISRLAAMEYGDIPYSMEKIDINGIITGIARQNEFPLKEKELALEISQPGEKIFVNADIKKLEEALQVLVNNAVKFSKKGKKIQISVQPGPGDVTISIKDQGIGIHKDDLERIFKKYERGRNAKNLKFEGTGIGLAVARDIIEKHSGKITVESVLDKGSTFTIKLPILKEEGGK
jgi:signal transduction histidine kinase/transcriptional regulator with GAF, ATPase, and Fis domain